MWEMGDVKCWEPLISTLSLQRRVKSQINSGLTSSGSRLSLLHWAADWVISERGEMLSKWLKKLCCQSLSAPTSFVGPLLSNLISSFISSHVLTNVQNRIFPSKIPRITSELTHFVCWLLTRWSFWYFWRSTLYCMLGLDYKINFYGSKSHSL